jgi:hypothetical protein
MKENVSVYPGVHGTQEVVDIDEYSRTTRSCHKKLQVRFNRVETLFRTFVHCSLGASRSGDCAWVHG